MRKDRRSGIGRGAFVSSHADAGAILWRWNHRVMAGQVDRGGKSDNAARNKQRGCGTAKNVSVNFAFRYQSLFTHHP